MAAPKGNKYGVKKSGEVYSEVVHCKVSPTDKRLFTEAAKEQKISLCSWMRIALRDAYSSRRRLS